MIGVSQLLLLPCGVQSGNSHSMSGEPSGGIVEAGCNNLISVPAGGSIVEEPAVKLNGENKGNGAMDGEGARASLKAEE